MRKNTILTAVSIILVWVAGYAQADDAVSDTAMAMYLANEGVMVVQGETKVVFDPLFRNGYRQYLLLPEPMKEALFAGRAPFDGIDAVFISHFHGDHFSPEDMLHLLKQQPDVRLYAPGQAVAGLRAVANSQDEALFARVTAVELAYKDPPVTHEMDGLLIEAVRIPHSGWPTGRLDVENISWRVTLDKTTTVLHLGDADPNDIHFARDAAYWDKTHLHMAFPPYWFFNSTFGPKVLMSRLKPDASVGVHVPKSIPTDPALRPVEFRKHDLFTRPGETRAIPVHSNEHKHEKHEH
jgi:L-ascorbate metabolism protein UlaG (beta-lactamase superfamily)